MYILWNAKIDLFPCVWTLAWSAVVISWHERAYAFKIYACFFLPNLQDFELARASYMPSFFQPQLLAFHKHLNFSSSGCAICRHFPEVERKVAIVHLELDNDISARQALTWVIHKIITPTTILSSLLEPFGPLWNVDKPAMFGQFWSKMDHSWAIASHEWWTPK